MDFKIFLFYAFALVLVFAALRVVTARNPVHSALFLVLAFFSASALWMLLHAEFLSILLILVYVGAVMVLFLFVVMMIDIDLAQLRADFWRHLPLAITIGAVIVLEMAFVLIKAFLFTDTNSAAPPVNTSNTRELGKLIFTEYVFAFEIAALILLVAMVAAVVITLRHRKDVKGQNPAQQVAIQRNQRVRMVQMAAETQPTQAAHPKE